MDIINDNDNKTDTKQTARHVGKPNKVKKVEGKKPVPAGASLDKVPETRSRARSTLVNPFDNKKPMNSKKESKPVETIGNERFNLLKSMFEKKVPAATLEVTTKKYEPKNFGFFQQKENNQTNEEKKSDFVFNQPAGISDGIKKRMQDLMNSNKRSSTQTIIDPILEKRRKEREMNDNDDEEEDEDEENLGISEDENSLDKDDEFSEFEEEKQKEDVKIEENKKERNDSILENEDSFEEKKEDSEVDLKKEKVTIEIKEEKNQIKSDSEQNAVSENTNQDRGKEIKNSLNNTNNCGEKDLQQTEISHEIQDIRNEEHKEQELNNNQIIKNSEHNEQF
jgi:hypothetical protein